MTWNKISKLRKDQLLSNPTTLLGGFDLIIRTGMITLSVLYLLFSIVVFQRVVTLTQTLQTVVSPIIKLLAILHLLVALGALVAIFLTLF